MAIAEFEAQSIQEVEPQTPKTELEQILDGITPPQPDPNDPRDPVEAQIYNLLGDITLPRSFLPSIHGIAVDQNRKSAEAIKSDFEANPNSIRTVKRLRSGHYPGISPESDQALIDAETKKRFQALTQHKPMIALRDEAQELYERYIKSGMKNHSTTEAYFMRNSQYLWERMHATAKDFLLYGDHRWIHFDGENDQADEILEKIMSTVNGFVRTGQSRGSVFVDTDETKQSWWNENEIGFHFQDGRITSILISDFVENKDGQKSVLMTYLRTQTETNRKIANKYPTDWKVGPFYVFYRDHDWGDSQYGIALSVEEWTKEDIEDFLKEYVNHIKNTKRLIPEEIVQNEEVN